MKDKIQRDGKDPIIPRIIAGLSFSFWEHLFSQKYEELWIRHLYKIFAKPPKKFTRKEWHKKLTPIRKLRNRIAHYECILNHPILESYKDIIECISYLDEEIAVWTDKISSTKKILKDKESILTSI